jgi:acyl carrier protein
MPESFSRSDIETLVIIHVAELSGEATTLECNLIDDLGLDSLDFAQLSVTLESEFAIGPIPDSDLFRLRTVEQVVHYVMAWLETKRSAVEIARVRVEE